MFSVKYENTASKFLKKLAVKSDVKRIFDKVEELALNPFPKDAKRVEGYQDPKVFRVRVGSYRILYFVNYPTSKLYIIKIDKRERVY
ncbi:TPA: type II toxin-antitoxin system RelE/ParE family toxin [Candidatus Woesearchaeota archaeon]|nr:type II toxin-antitoxin system mRNA interferase toxin, RelE/StbE family [archaeon]HIJ11731.1 type II toxin-antitoxin system RelE/ParE family toxin [Candidatus Woesearchaeota archaeon]